MTTDKKVLLVYRPESQLPRINKGDARLTQPLSQVLGDEGYAVTTVSSIPAARTAIENSSFDAIVVKGGQGSEVSSLSGSFPGPVLWGRDASQSSVGGYEAILGSRVQAFDTSKGKQSLNAMLGALKASTGAPNGSAAREPKPRVAEVVPAHA